MGFYIRKSVRLGPIQLNFSKSGVGISFGVKGARLSTGPRGTYIHVGSNGIYYRQKIGQSTSDDSAKSPNHSDAATQTTPSGVSIDDLVDSSSAVLLNQINSRIQQPTHAPIVGVIATAVAVAIASVTFIVRSYASTILDGVYPLLVVLPIILGTSVFILGMIITRTTSQQEQLARISTLHYELSDTTKELFIAVQNALDNLSKSAALWQIDSRMSNWDWKRHAGATSLVTRKRIVAGYMRPPFIQTKIKVYGISLDATHLYFLPDQVFVFQNGKYGAVSYSSFQVDFSISRFIEDESTPSDSAVIDHTWRYVRKDGGPDLRYMHNRQIPIVQYGYIELSSKLGLDLHLQVSNVSYAQQFAQALTEYIRHSQPSHTTSWSKTSYNQHGTKQADTGTRSKPEENPYTVLGVSPNASLDEIAAAYRKMAQMYHPDKVAALAPEFRELAEKRMKAINTAYEQLKKSFNR